VPYDGASERRFAMTENGTSLRERIVRDPNILAGKPTIRGTRVPVSLILNLLAHGYSFERIVEAYPYVHEEDIRASLLYAESVMNGMKIEAMAS
jgi:uncharacterized protein (DUF433 family)